MYEWIREKAAREIDNIMGERGWQMVEGDNRSNDYGGGGGRW